VRRNRIQEKWDEFSRLVLPPNCSTTQRWEMRRAFYAGVEGLFKLILRDLTPGSEAEAPDLQMLTDMTQELAEFAERIKQGTA
jgi:hypothetical protein